MKMYCLLCLFTLTSFANPVVNVYVWGGEIPKQLIQQFEKETGIQVNFSTYDNNETMFAKLKAGGNRIYDVVLPSSYFVERMRRSDMLIPLDLNQLPNLRHLDHLFVNNSYDPHNQYSVPLTWGITGIFYHVNWVKQEPPYAWSSLWNNHWEKKLLLLDDEREVFALALISLGFDPNDSNPVHIAKAYHHLLKLIPNIKLFASESIQAVMIDEDAIAGSVWNGDAYKAHAENKQIQFIYPEDGFVIWVDCLAIPRNAPHPKEAYAFINFLLKPESAAIIGKVEGHAITNARGKRLLPKSMQNNPILYPNENTLKHGYFQRDVGEETIELYNRYWQQFKLAF